MDIKPNILERFKKDYSLPIPLSDSRYFEYYLNTIDKHYDSINKFNEFLEVYNHYQDTFLDHSMNLINRIINGIKETDFYQKFNSNDFNNIQLNRISNLDILYKEENIGSYFVKIDLKQANYSALKYINQFIDSDISFFQDTYEDFINSYTPYSYYQHSKKIRQVIFGNLNPKRQQKIQQHIISKIYDYIISNSLLLQNNLMISSSDELIFKINENLYENIEQHLSTIFDIFSSLHIEAFKLDGLKSTFATFYIQDFKDKVRFKHVPLTLFMQVYKKYTNQPIDEKDLLFYDGKFIAKYIEELTWI